MEGRPKHREKGFGINVDAACMVPYIKLVTHPGYMLLIYHDADQDIVATEDE